MVYMDDGIFLGNYDSKLQDAIKEIQDIGLNIDNQGLASSLSSELSRW